MKVSGSRCRQGFKSRLEGVGLRKKSFFFWLNLVRLYSLYKKIVPKKEDIILLYIGYHSIPK